MSNLMQQILDKIERDAAAASAAAMKHSGLIYEAESLRDQLHATGLTTAEPTFIEHGNYAVIFYDHERNSRMREALAAIGVEIEDESYHIGVVQPPNTRDAHLSLKGFDCRIWICYDPIPLAEAA